MEADEALGLALAAWEAHVDVVVEAAVAEVMEDVFLEAAVYGIESVDPAMAKLMELTGRSIS